VTDVVERLESRALSGPNVAANRLREALSDFLADAAERACGFFQRRRGKCFAERIGRRFGESQGLLERAGKRHENERPAMESSQAE